MSQSYLPLNIFNSCKKQVKPLFCHYLSLDTSLFLLFPLQVRRVQVSFIKPKTTEEPGSCVHVYIDISLLTHTGGARYQKLDSVGGRCFHIVLDLAPTLCLMGCAAFTGLMPQKCFQQLRIAAAVGEPCPGSPSQVSDMFS